MFTNQYLFNGLVTRDLTYSMLVNIWRLSRPQPLSPDLRSELSQAQNEASTKEPEKRKRDYLRTRLALARNAARKRAEKDGSGSEEDSQSDGDNEEDDEGSSKEGHADGSNGDHAPTECACSRNKEHYHSVVLDHVYDTTMKHLVDLFYKTDFMENFWREKQQLLDIQVSDWTQGKSDTPGAIAWREINYVKPLNGSIGPKQTRCNITEEEVHIDFNEYCSAIQTTRTPDVPNGNSFCIKTRICVMWAAGGKTRLVVTCETVWKGRSMLRGIIDKASIDGQKQYYSELNAELVREISRKAGASADEQEAAAATAESEYKEEDAAITDTVAEKDTRSKVMSSLKSIGEIRPTVFVLSMLIFVLILSHVWMYVAGPSYTRDPGNPHRLTRRRGAAPVQAPGNSQQASALIENELSAAMHALERSRRITERLETDVQELQAIVSGLTS